MPVPAVTGIAAPPAAVIFDLNGTLSDDEPILESIFRALLAERGIALSRAEYYGELAGLSDLEIAERGLARAGRAPGAGAVGALVAEKVARYRARVAAASPVAADTAALVRALAGRVPVAVVTGALRAEAEAVLGAAGLLGLLTATICAEDVRRGKPDPEGYRRARHALGAPPAGSVLVFEDSLVGIRAAKAAGMRCLAVRGTAPAPALAAAADGVVERLEPALAAELLHA